MRNPRSATREARGFRDERRYRLTGRAAGRRLANSPSIAINNVVKGAWVTDAFEEFVEARFENRVVFRHERKQGQARLEFPVVR